MSPSLETDFHSPSPSPPPSSSSSSFLQNPNPTLHKPHTTFALNFTPLAPDPSTSSAADHPSRKKKKPPLKVKKHSLTSNHVNDVISRGKSETVDFVFNLSSNNNSVPVFGSSFGQTGISEKQSVGDVNDMLHFSIGSVDSRKPAKSSGLDEVLSSGNETKRLSSVNNNCGPVFESSFGQSLSAGEKQRVGEFLDVDNMLHFSIGSVDSRKPAKSSGLDEALNSGNETINVSEVVAKRSGKVDGLNFLFGDNLHFSIGSVNDRKPATSSGLDEALSSGNETMKVSERDGKRSGKVDGLNFVFGGDMKNGVCDGTDGASGIDGFTKANDAATEADSFLASRKSAKSSGLDEALNSGNAKRSGKVDGLNFVFGGDMKNGECDGTEGASGVDGFTKVKSFTTEADSFLASSISGLNLGTGERVVVDRFTKEENNAPGSSSSTSSTNFVNLDFAFAADRSDLNKQKQKVDKKVDEVVSDGKVEVKPDANLVFGTSGKLGTVTEEMGKEDFSAVDSGKTFGDSKVNGLFQLGSENNKRFSCKGRRKLSKKVNSFKSEGAGNCDRLKKQDNNVDSVRDGNFSFVFGGKLGNDFSNTTQSKVFEEPKTSSIHGTTNNNISSNSFVFGSDKRNITSEKSNATTLNQDEVSKQNYQNQPKTEPELSKEKVPSSTNFSFPSNVGVFANSFTVPSSSSSSTNFSFPSNVGVFATSSTGFNTPDINFASPFTSDMFPGLRQKLEFSKSNPVSQRKSKKTKTKIRQQSSNHQQGRCSLSKEAQQSFEGSPMDFSPYGDTEGVSTSTDPATSQTKNEDTVGTTTDKFSENNLSSSSTPSVAVGTTENHSARQRPHKKKYIMKTGQGLKSTIREVSHAHESTSGKRTEASDQEICDSWRKRGNQAYKKSDLSEAEACYSKGISSIRHTETPGFCIESLLLCYSNRAAARMALGRLREGLEDCRTAATLDPTFVKANLRSANCHLLLGELEDASYNYNKCLDSENIVCLDRRLAIEAADGLQKVQKVANYLKQSAELLQQKTNESAATALGFIADALSLSCYSEKLLHMKGEALHLLGKHKDVVQLCEKTLDSAEKNFATESKLWRWNLMSKSSFQLGRLEIALDFIEKHEQLRLTADKITDSQDSLSPLAVIIHELLHCKNAGNEAFQNGKHSKAIEHYSAAISKSMESHSFAAVCFCNRAAAHQSLGEIIDAIGDCSAAIALDGTYSKALSRRSTLWEMIRDYKNAADDLQRLISILETRPADNSQKSNGSVKDLRRARRRLSSIEETSKKERSLNLYLILGIKSSDTAAEVKKAYRKAALRHHPDKAGQVIARAESGTDGQKWKVITELIQMDADKLFKLIGEAYAVLSDGTKRSKYDLEEEMWDDTNTHATCSSRRASDFYNSPFDAANRRNSHYSNKTYGNSHHYYWEERRNYHNSYTR